MNTGSINILIAEDNDLSRQLMSSILKTKGYDIFEAVSGQEAMSLVREHTISLALVDLNMEPVGGFEFVTYLKTNKINIPVIIITADESSDLLVRANEVGVARILQKPVDPDKLLKITEQTLQKYKPRNLSIASQVVDSKHSPEDLMKRAIEIAKKNAQSGKGGPFGAVVANKDGKILGEGTNGMTSRVDPTAHAEIMAIRKAAEKLGRADLSDCVLYCSSEPTMMGQALIISVSIPEVYFGLSHEDVMDIQFNHDEHGHHHEHEQSIANYKQLCHNEAAAMFQQWKDAKNKG
ncbi:MAG: response regulator [Alphaproteobacteria bacterium]|nr:response regulator [Alphaproteobacteria bacterium]